jgi:hypothetical protein
MPDCEKLPKCAFFNDRMANKPATANMMKKQYCQGDKSTCARYLVCTKKGPEAVPGDLFPNMLDRAKAILAS